MKRLLNGMLLFAAIAAVSATASADMMTLPDTLVAGMYVGGGSPFPNYLPVYPGQDGAVGFSLASIPAGATILSADLTLGPSLENYLGGGGPGDSMAYATDKPWDATATWYDYSTGNPWPTLGGDQSGTGATDVVTPVLAGAYAGQYILNYNVTSIVSQWYSGALPNDGFLIANDGVPGILMMRGPAGTPDTYMGGLTNVAPTLTVTYVVGVPEPGSALLLGCGAVGLLWVSRRCRRGARLR